MVEGRVLSYNAGHMGVKLPFCSSLERMRGDLKEEIENSGVEC